MTRQPRPASQLAVAPRLWLLAGADRLRAARAPAEPAAAAAEAGRGRVRARGPLRDRPGGSLGSREPRGLDAFLATLPGGRRQSARVVGHADQRAGRWLQSRALAAPCRDRGAQSARGGHRARGGDRGRHGRDDGHAPCRRRRRPRPAIARSRSWSRASEVVLPGCPDWTRDPGYDPLNLPLSNLGCANAVNLGLMVADPGDLARTVPTSPADGTREAEAIARYRTDKVKQLEADIIQ